MHKLACFCGATGSNGVDASRRGFLSGLGALGAAALLPGCQSSGATVAGAKAHRIDIHHHIVPPKYAADLARLGGGGAPKWSAQAEDSLDSNVRQRTEPATEQAYNISFRFAFRNRQNWKVNTDANALRQGSNIITISLTFNVHRRSSC